MYTLAYLNFEKSDSGTYYVANFTYVFLLIGDSEVILNNVRIKVRYL